MKHNLFALVILVAIGMSLGACHSPAGPTPTPPPPDQSGYEPLPTEPHRLLATDGSPTHMWAVLTSVSPLRGSIIIINQPPTSATCMSCFSLNITVGLDALPNPSTATHFIVYFSQDGVTLGRVVWSNTIRGSGTATSNPDLFIIFSEKPQYLVVQASYGPDGVYNMPGESGTTKCFLDYK